MIPGEQLGSLDWLWLAVVGGFILFFVAVKIVAWKYQAKGKK